MHQLQVTRTASSYASSRHVIWTDKPVHLILDPPLLATSFTLLSLPSSASEEAMDYPPGGHLPRPPTSAIYLVVTCLTVT